MAFCSECGAKLEDAVKFCPECGVPRQGVSQTNGPPSLAPKGPPPLPTKAPKAPRPPRQTENEEPADVESILETSAAIIAASNAMGKTKRNMRNADVAVRCAKCGSTEVTTQEKGFGLGKAAIGGILLGPVGLAAGMLGRKKIKLICLKCGHKWQAGKR
jgi:tellurium resistance protein TerD